MTETAAIVVDTLTAVDAALTLIPKRARQGPRVFAVHRLTMKPLGRAEQMSFEAACHQSDTPRVRLRRTGHSGPGTVTIQVELRSVVDTRSRTSIYPR